MNDLEQFRTEKDEFFKTSRQSPLTAEQKREFNGLHYYPENPSLRLELKLERFAQAEPVILATSTGDEQEYFRVGQIRFEVTGQEAILQVYEADYGFFLPFVDATAPKETYGAGRYLEPHNLGGDLVAVIGSWKYHGCRGLAWPAAALARCVAAAAELL